MERGVWKRWQRDCKTYFQTNRRLLPSSFSLFSCSRIFWRMRLRSLLKFISLRPLLLYFFHNGVISKRIRMIIDNGNIFPDEFLDISEILFFFRITESDSNSLCTCSACTTDAMNVGFRDIWEFKIHNVCELIDIDTPCSYIGCDEDTSDF